MNINLPLNMNNIVYLYEDGGDIYMGANGYQRGYMVGPFSTWAPFNWLEDANMKYQYLPDPVRHEYGRFVFTDDVDASLFKIAFGVA